MYFLIFLEYGMFFIIYFFFIEYCIFFFEVKKFIKENLVIINIGKF